jgi:DNA-binding PadR family transcriptional regulator
MNERNSHAKGGMPVQRDAGQHNKTVLFVVPSSRRVVVHAEGEVPSGRTASLIPPPVIICSRLIILLQTSDVQVRDIVTPSDPRELLPLPPHDLHVLLALLDGPRHAYGLSQAVDDVDGDVRLEIGSLYRILSRLTRQGVIENLDPPAGAEGHEGRRRYYRITAFGRRVAAAEAERLASVIRLARRHKLLPSRGPR